MGDIYTPSEYGYFPMQQHRFGVESLPLDKRHVLYGVRIDHRDVAKDTLGHYRIVPESGGDIIGGFLWIPENEQRRFISGWQFHWPVRAHTIDERNRLNRTGQPGTTPTQGGGFGQGVGALPPVPTGVAGLPPPPTIVQPLTFQFPLWNPGYAIDDRFARELPTYNPHWNRTPGGTIGMVVDSTTETAQEPLYLHTDPRIIAVNFAGDPTCGTFVCDLNDKDEIDVQRQAHAQSFWRVVRLNASCFPVRSDLNQIAWQLGRAGRDSLEGLGLCYDTEGDTVPRPNRVAVPGGRGTVAVQGPPPNPTVVQGEGDKGIIGSAGVAASGPLDVGPETDQHRWGVTKDGEPCNALHIQTEAYFLGDGGDGPLEFQQVLYQPPLHAPMTTRVHLRWDPNRKHRFICGDRDGEWRWLSETFWYPPSTPPTGGPPPGPPGPPPPPPPGGGGPGGGGPGGGGSGGGGPGGGLPPEVTGGPGNVVPSPFVTDDPGAAPINTGSVPRPSITDRSGSRGIENLPPAPDSVPLLDEPAQELLRRYRPRSNGDPTDFLGASITPMASPAVLFRPSDHSTTRFPDLRNVTTPQFEVVSEWDKVAPVTARVEGYTKQVQAGGNPVYTERPGQSRYGGGTAGGGIVVTPPERDAADYQDPDDIPQRDDVSTTCVVVTPGAKIGTGAPDVVDGGMRGHYQESTDLTTIESKIKSSDGSASAIDDATIACLTRFFFNPALPISAFNIVVDEPSSSFPTLPAAARSPTPDEFGNYTTSRWDEGDVTAVAITGSIPEDLCDSWFLGFDFNYFLPVDLDIMGENILFTAVLVTTGKGTTASSAATATGSVSITGDTGDIVTGSDALGRMFVSIPVSLFTGLEGGKFGLLVMRRGDLDTYPDDVHIVSGQPFPFYGPTTGIGITLVAVP